MKPVRIGICGLGTVGSGTFNVLTRNAREISARAGTDIIIEQVGARRDNPACDTSSSNVTRDVFEVARNPDVDVVVELIGGTTVAKELVEEAIASGKHVVTANKALIAEFGNELFAKAEAKGVTISFEAAVAGGIPIIKALREGLSGNRVEWLAGIINGTGNFILTEMKDKGRAFEDVLKEAQKLGYAEADPTFDVEGIDAAHKLVILASIAFGMPLQFDKIFTEGISAIEPQDLTYAESLGYRIKHLGIARQSDKGVELRVHPTLIPAKRLIANVNGVMNAVLVKGDAVGPTLYYGAGAGAEPTASAVVADLVDVARGFSAAQENKVAHLGFAADALQDLPVLPISEVTTAYYLRMTAEDRPGVLNKVTQILSDSGISIEAVIQKEPEEGGTEVPLILLTNRAVEKQLMEAIDGIERLEAILGEITHIRVESLG
ncbi:homoserine dehydrogenase [Pseudomaricurvus hydrocarbonicus]|uniref:homoserine dehydrogenase n=1 Tax=Pseudomaricurvus hydrocarbonicus TaxID=1470433 RepID=UPI001AA02052|nr:homoserine dehydrogenase [Aestuariicella hydrocarbonica]